MNSLNIGIIMRLVRFEGAVMRIFPEAPLHTSVSSSAVEDRRCSNGEHSLKKRSPASVKESLRACLLRSLRFKESSKAWMRRVMVATGIIVLRDVAV